MAWLLRIALVVVCAVVSTVARAQAPDPPEQPDSVDVPSGSSSPGPSGSDDAASSAEPEAPRAKAIFAKTLFKQGLELASTQQWAVALDRFRQSEKLYPTKVAALNVAICLRNLHRYADSLEAYDSLEVRFSRKLTEADLGRIAEGRRVAEERVGALVVTTEPEGAQVSIDGTERGTSPLLVRVDAGTRSVRLYREGYEVAEKPATVIAKKTVRLTVKLQRQKRTARVRVIEKSSAQLDVYVDGAVVGQTPWEGDVSAGEHTIYLRGTTGETDFDDLSTSPQTLRVEIGQEQDLVLEAKRLDARLTVEARPYDSEIRIDGVVVGFGRWEGPVLSGSRTVVAVREGYVGAVARPEVESGGHAVVTLNLARETTWDRFVVEAAGGLMVAPSLGGSLDAACAAEQCAQRSRPFGFWLGGYGGVRLGENGAAGLAAGFARVVESATRDQVAFRDGRVIVSSDFHEEATASGPWLGAFASYRFFERTPLTFRLTAGVWLAKLDFDDSQGYFFDFSAASPLSEVTFPEESRRQTVPLVAPEARFGYRVSRQIVVDVGVSAVMLFARGFERQGSDGARISNGASSATLPSEAAIGTAVGLVPSVALRYEL